MLKLLFRTSMKKPEAWYESAYAATQHTCDGTERPGGSWIALIGELEGGEQQGIILANNAKHSYSASGSDFAVTLLRSPSYATHDPHPHNPNEELDYLDQGHQHFNYTLSLAEPSGPFPSTTWAASAARRAALVNIPPISLLESAHEGKGLPRHYTGAYVTPPNVLATAIKRSEENDGWIIRLYETTGVACNASITLHAIAAEWHGPIGKFEIKTLHISNTGVRVVNLIEE